MVGVGWPGSPHTVTNSLYLVAGRRDKPCPPPGTRLVSGSPAEGGTSRSHLSLDPLSAGASGGPRGTQARAEARGWAARLVPPLE